MPSKWEAKRIAYLVQAIRKGIEMHIYIYSHASRSISKITILDC